MDIGHDISRWILEFILRKPLDDATLAALIRVLPPPDNNPGLAKSILLREIESEVSNGSVSEKIVGLLEKFEELDFREGIEASEALKAAYCAVAVDCTVRFLKKGGEKRDKGEYFSAVKRLWRKRICRMEKWENVGLVSEDLSNWREQIEAAVWEDSCENVIRMNEGVDAAGTVKAFVKETREKMGPSFLEFVAATLRRDDDLRESLISENRKDQSQCTGKVVSLPSSGQAKTHQNIDKEFLNGKPATKQKHVACKRTRATLGGTSRGAKIADMDDPRVEASNRQCGLPDTPKVSNAQKELEKSSMELHAAVKDPLQDALLIAATIMCDMARGNSGNPHIQENPDNATCPVGGSTGGVVATHGGNLNNNCSPHRANPSKRSLMERRSTAHAIEWDDSIENCSTEGSPSHGRRPQLPSPQKRNSSPLKEYQIKNLTKRRKIKKWSLIEEDTLRTGVQKFGKGNWKFILHAYRDIFEDRTEVDLKDKWRNMTRY
ncbi:unnamed protein product [Cuscuta campestris]|uniref:Uncharacterized protein n=1 Tax=Cuscuta campestris TaxID=132261 RepID=A0A484LU97_9ASTE|nr:unnamed protein product [Cuscuta campestris]